MTDDVPTADIPGRTVHDAITGTNVFVPYSPEEIAQNQIDNETVAALEAAIPRCTIDSTEVKLTRSTFNSLRDLILTATALGDDTITFSYASNELICTIEEASTAMKIYLTSTTPR